MNFDELKEFMLGAHGRFYDLVPSCAKEYPGLCSFDAVDRCDGVRNQLVWRLQVKGMLREGVNCLNAWCSQLHIWGIWLKVLPEYDDMGQWEIEMDLVDPVAYFCMMQPAATYDRFIEIAESMLHQGNLICIPGYKDKLMQDDHHPKGRIKTDVRLKQLDELGKDWRSYKEFRNLFRQIDGKDYRRSTFNYRNKAQHSLPNRLGRGLVPHVSRSIEPYEEMVPQDDGGYLRVPHPSRKVVSYGFGEQYPLDMEKARSANLKQYQLSKKAMAALGLVVDEIVSTHRKEVADSP